MTIDFAPASLLAEIVQNIRTLLRTVKGSVPLDRAFGMSGNGLDDPLPVARALISREIVDAVARYEPRAEVVRVECETDELRGSLRARVIFRLRGPAGDYRLVSLGWGEPEPGPAPEPEHLEGARFLRLAAEFAGGGLWWDPESEFGHSGQMVFAADGQPNAYAWTTLDGEAVQEYCVKLRFGVPAGYEEWKNCRFWGRISADAGEGTAVLLTDVEDTTGARVGLDVPVEIAASDWTAAEFEMPAGVYAEGGFVTLVFRLRAAAKAGEVLSYAYLGDVALDAW